MRPARRGAYDEVARTLWIGPAEVATVGKGTIAVICAGTADLPVAQEAASVTLFRKQGGAARRRRRGGAAPPARASETLAFGARLIVVAGMEGALPSVVGGLVGQAGDRRPHERRGYGASFGGVAALLGMLTSCASNVTVVNIDNGFGAAHVATLINRL